MSLSKNIKENTKVYVKGLHIISVCDARSQRAKRLEYLIENVRIKREALIAYKQATKERMKELWEEYQYYIQQLHKGYLVDQTYIENITTTVGRSVLAQRLSGDTTYSGTVNYTALGTDNTAPAVGNTTLGTETYRKTLSSGADSNNVSYIETFFTMSEISGTFEEYGNFIDGGAGADTGQLFNRFTTQTAKSGTETLNVQSIVTFNDA